MYIGMFAQLCIMVERVSLHLMVFVACVVFQGLWSTLNNWPKWEHLRTMEVSSREICKPLPRSDDQTEKHLQGHSRSQLAPVERVGKCQLVMGREYRVNIEFIAMKKTNLS